MNQRQWLKTRKHLLESVKNQVFSRLGPPVKSLENYSRKLDREFTRRWQSSSLLEMVQAARSSDLLFLADFHAYHQSQRAHLRLLRQMDLSSSVVFLECLKTQDSHWIDLFWSGEMNEAEFLSAIQWSVNWGFPWEHYRDLILFLKEHQVLVRGISSSTFYDLRLKARDQKMAQIIEEELLIHPSDQVIVIAGEKHLHEDHLPKMIALKSCFSFERQVRIFQDNEVLYFKNSQISDDSNLNVLKRKDSFCWNVSPPWVKWQSYLIYLERTFDQELEDDELDFEDYIKAFVTWMCQDLKLDVSSNNLEVFTPTGTAEFSTEIPSSILKELMGSERSFMLNEKGRIYLSRPSVNHASSVAGQFIHNQLSQREKMFYDLPSDIERRLFIETIGFFFSKWMNPQRKAGTFEDLKIRLESFQSRKTPTQTMRLVSEIFVYGQRLGRGDRVGPKNKRTLKKTEELSQLEAVRFLGRIFGKALFEGVLSKRISLEELKNWLSLRLEDKEFPKTFWERIVPRLI